MKLFNKLFQYKHTNSKGVTYYLYKSNVKLRGGKEHTIYYFAKKGAKKGEPSRLPKDRFVNENPRNGFLSTKPNGDNND